MSAQIIRIRRRDWLLGMHWVSSDQAMSREAIRQEAQQLGAHWVVKRATTDTRQTGFAAVDSRIRPWRLYSLAATLAETFAPPWAGVFDLGDGVWWYLAVGEGSAVLPDGDVVGDFQTIQQARENHRDLARWVVHEGDLDTLSLMLAKPRALRVRPLSGWTFSFWQWVALGASVMLVMAVAVWWFQYQKTIRRLHDQQLQQQAKLEAGHEGEFQHSPMPESWAMDCQRTLESIPLSRFGWQAGAITCQGTLLEVNWEWKEGALLTLRPEGTVSESGNQVVQQLSLARELEPGSDNRQDVDREKEALRNWAQAAGLDLSFENGIPLSDKRVRFRLFSPVMPFGFNFDSLPGLRLQRMSSATEGWEIQGVLYGKP